MFRRTWTFANTIRVYRKDLLPKQLRRYQENRRLGCNYHEPIEEEHFTKALRHLRSGAVVIDVGAALGYYSILTRILRPDLQVHAINPDSHFILRMQATTSLNKIAGIRFHQLALSDKPGRGYLPLGSYGARLERHVDGEIEISTLDELVAHIGSPVELLKIDVQGEELNVLLGAKQSLSLVHKIILGTHGASIHERCSTLLSDLGYIIEYSAENVPRQPDGLIVAYQPKL